MTGQATNIQEPDGRDQGVFVRRWGQVGVVLLTAGVLAVLVFSVQASGFKQALSFIAFGLALSGASLLVGGLIGFLFGIPRKLQEQPDPKEKDEGSEGREVAAQRSLYGGNTNLEQISDWLTKILVGVGLTQIAGIGTAISNARAFAQAGFGGLPASGEFGTALILHFLVSGFLVGYLWTRIYLGRALTEAEQTVELKREIDSLRQTSLANALALELASRQLLLEKDPVDQDELDKAIKGASADIRAAIFYRAYNQRSQNWRSRTKKPLMERTIPLFRALANCDTARQYHKNFGQLGFALKDQRTPDWQGAAEALTAAIQIRGEKVREDWYIYEFARALCRINLDPDFQANRPSSPENKQEILNDVTLGKRWATAAGADIEESITKWCELNP
jgi:hypothetical protein